VIPHRGIAFISLLYKFVKKCSASHGIETTMIYHHASGRMATIQNTNTAKACKGVEQQGLSFTADGKENGTASWKGNLAASCKTIQQSFSLVS
jgi:hypothetical protein